MGVWSDGIACYEEAGSRKESWKNTSMTGSVVLDCAWADRYALMADIMGTPRAWPGCAAAIATQFDIDPDGTLQIGTTDGSDMIYEGAVCSITYSTDESQDLWDESIEPNVEFITLDHKRFTWTNAKGPQLQENEAPGRQQFSTALVRTLKKVEPPLPAGLLTHVGKTNSAAYTSSLLGLTFGRGTLLFMPSSLNRTVKNDGSRAFDVKVSFSYNPNGWNTFFRAETQRYETIWDKKANMPYNSYPYDDFGDFLY